MGLIRTTLSSLGGIATGAAGSVANSLVGSAQSVISDQYREYFYCEAFPENILAKKGQKKNTKGQNKGTDNIISNGSIITINEGQCMILVDQGKVTEVCAEAGEFIYDASSEPSIFYGKLGESLKQSFLTLGKRITFGGEVPKDQRIYYINTKEVRNNFWGTSAPIPMFIHDKVTGFQGDISIRAHGQYSYIITDPVRFYTYVCTNVADTFDKREIESMMKSELATYLQPALGTLSELGLRYSQIPAHAESIKDELNKLLSEKWRELRGISIYSFAIDPITATPEDEKRIKEFQDTAVYTNVNMAAARMVTAQANAMEAAASNESTGPMMAFAGMNMAQMAGGGNNSAANLFAMGQQQQPAPAAPAAAPAAAPVAGWDCACGAKNNTGKFCAECGTTKPVEQSGWACSCGAINKGKFCAECGLKKPAGVPLYKCDKCGWEPADPSNPPKFCPECGDPFDESDVQ